MMMMMMMQVPGQRDNMTQQAHTEHVTQAYQNIVNALSFSPEKIPHEKKKSTEHQTVE